MVDAGDVKKIKWTEDAETIQVYDKDDKAYKTANPRYEDFKKDMLEQGIDVEEKTGVGKYETPIMIVVQLLIYGT